MHGHGMRAARHHWAGTPQNDSCASWTLHPSREKGVVRGVQHMVADHTATTIGLAKVACPVLDIRSYCINKCAGTMGSSWFG